MDHVYPGFFLKNKIRRNFMKNSGIFQKISRLNSAKEGGF